MSMTLARLADGLVAVPAGAAGLMIESVALDSRRVVPGSLFAALPSATADDATDRQRHIADAVARGAVAVLAPEHGAWPDGVPFRPLLRAADPRAVLARLAARAAGPQPEQIVAITGTNGKTSTADFLRQIWSLDRPGAASLGTLGLVSDVAVTLQAPPLTTPDSVTLAVILAGLARHGVRACALEASSHGLEQSRLDGVSLTAAGFSNLTRDHLDYHGSLERYRDAKLRLFSDLLPRGAVAAANADMEPATLDRLREIATARGLALRLCGGNGDALRLRRAVPLPDGQVLEVEENTRRHEIRLALPGRFQADNVLLAALLAEPEPEALPRVLNRLGALVGVRGRMELAARLPNGAAAYVDYAHTPDALERLLGSLRPHAAEGGGRLVIVFGAGGDRDRGKRALMGAAAARLADQVFVTDDNPRGEDPAAIRAAILAACPGAAEIGDREAAIAAGLSALRPGDVLVVAGKGHEQGQIVGSRVQPFDDAGTVRRLAGCA